MQLIDKVKNPKNRGLQLMAVGGVLFFLPNLLGQVDFVGRTSFFLTFAGVGLFLGGIFLNGSLNGQPVSSNARKGLWTMYWAALIAFSPIGLAALATAPGHNMWSESDSQSGGSVIWLMLLTIPVGLIMGIVGLVMAISGAGKKPTS